MMDPVLRFYSGGNAFPLTVNLAAQLGTARIDYLEFLVTQIHGVHDFTLQSDLIHSTWTDGRQVDVKGLSASIVLVSASEVRDVNAHDPLHRYVGFMGEATVAVSNIISDQTLASFRVNVEFPQNCNILIRVQIINADYNGQVAVPFPVLP
jgi:hypothetical protein